MKKIFQRFLKRQADSFPTAEELLAGHMSKSDLRDLFSFCPDKREVFRSAALALHKNEEEFVRDVAQHFSFGYAERIFPMDLSLLPEGVTLEHFKRIGAIGITKDHVLQGVVAVDPSLVKKLFPNIQRADILLAPWEKIRNAIQESEKTYIQALAEKKNQESLKSDVVVQIFEYIWSEANKHQCSKVRIVLTDESIEYVLLGDDEKQAKGTVHSSFRKGMLHLLKKEKELLPSGMMTQEVTPMKEYLLVSSANQDQEEVDSADQQEQQAPSNVVQLPVKHLKKEEVSAEQADTEEVHIGGHVLIVDDNKVFRDVLTRFLERKGVRVECAERADQAFYDLAHKEKSPDLVICDMHIPGMNGLTFVGKIRNDDELCELPVIMLSSDDTVETKLQCIGAGADLYLQKSEDPRLLCAHVVRILTKRKKSEAA